MILPKAFNLESATGTNLLPSLLESDIFTLLLADGRSFNIHQSILEKSPVFNRICAGPFKESDTKTIELPDDDALSMQIILQCIYRDLKSGNNVWKEVYEEFFEHSDSRLEQMGLLYIAANKYDFTIVQDYLAGSFYELALHADDAVSFFQLAEVLYPHASSADAPFRKYFQLSVRDALAHVDEESMRTVDGIIDRGGVIATDIFRAQREMLREARTGQQESEAQVVRLQTRKADLARRHAALRQRFEAAREEHRCWHGEGRRCPFRDPF